MLTLAPHCVPWHRPPGQVCAVQVSNLMFHGVFQLKGRLLTALAYGASVVAKGKRAPRNDIKRLITNSCL